MHHLQVPAGTKRLVHGPPVECRIQERPTLRHALKGVLQSLPVVFRQTPGAVALQDTGEKADDQIISDQASQPVASSCPSRYPGGPPQFSGGQAPEPPVQTG